MGGMAFRDMEIFNLALLARQAWRILTKDTSLSPRMLKAIYFPRSNLLEAELGSHPSQIWRAMLDACDILAQGIIHRIRDGESTGIWTHNWISREGMMRPLTSLMQNPPERVLKLIDVTIATWREDVAR